MHVQDMPELPGKYVSGQVQVLTAEEIIPVHLSHVCQKFVKVELFIRPFSDSLDCTLGILVVSGVTDQVMVTATTREDSNRRASIPMIGVNVV